MKPTIKNIIAGLTLMTSLSSFAGGEVGNGGDVIVCPGSVRLLDHVEAEKKKLQISLPEGSLEKKVSFVAEKYIKLDEYRGILFKRYAKEFIADLNAYENGQEILNTTFVQDPLADVDDSFDLAIPKGCTKEQLVIRRDKKSIKSYDIYHTEYVVNEDLWNELDEDNKAMTVIHEIFYKLATNTMGAENSKSARHLNGVLSSNKALSLSEYMEIIDRLIYLRVVEDKDYHMAEFKRLEGYAAKLRGEEDIFHSATPAGRKSMLDGKLFIVPNPVAGYEIGFTEEDKKEGIVKLGFSRYYDIPEKDGLKFNGYRTLINTYNKEGKIIDSVVRINATKDFAPKFSNGKIKFVSSVKGIIKNNQLQKIVVLAESIEFIKIDGVKTKFRDPKKEVSISLKGDRILGFTVK